MRVLILECMAVMFKHLGKHLFHIRNVYDAPFRGVIHTFSDLVRNRKRF